MKIVAAILLGLLMSSPLWAKECDWQLEPGRLGPLKVGMTIPQAQAALGMPLILTGSSDDTDYYYQPSRCKDAFKIIATNYNTDDAGTVWVAMIVAGTAATVDGIHVGDLESRLLPLKTKYGKRLTRELQDKYDETINAYTIAAEPANEHEFVLSYFAPGGKINSIVASAMPYVYRVDIGRPKGRWWTK
jgi:hypothetical protein